MSFPGSPPPPPCAWEALHKTLPVLMCKDLANVVMDIVAPVLPEDTYNEFDSMMVAISPGIPIARDYPRIRFQLRPVSPCVRARCNRHKPVHIIHGSSGLKLGMPVTARPVLRLMDESGIFVLSVLFPFSCLKDCRAHPVVGCDFPGCCHHPVANGYCQLYGVNGSHALQRYLLRLWEIAQK
jgi:hypothetical protein